MFEESFEHLTYLLRLELHVVGTVIFILESTQNTSQY